MEPLEWIALISGILGLLGVGVDVWQTNKANKRQEEHDEAMAALNHRYREEEAISSFNRELGFNQFEDASKKMVQAGLSPSLMYGGSNMATNVPSVSSVGSSQGAGNVGRHVSVSDFLGKLDPFEYSSQALERINAKNMQQKTFSDIMKNRQDIAESISRTLENRRNTAFQKSLERTLLDQEDQTLQNLKTQGEQMKFDLAYSRDVRDIRFEKEQLQNVELRKQVDLTVERIKSEPVQRAYLRKEMEGIDAGIRSSDASTALSGEQLKNGQLHRIMSEFGINGRSVNLGVGSLQNLRPGMVERMKGASLALQELGFSPREADQAVLYYIATDKKDVTPSALNGLSRILSSAVK